MATLAQLAAVRASPSSMAMIAADITDDTRISLQQLTSWNPWVGADCDKGLYADLKDGDQRPVCIGVNSTAKDTASLALSGL
ncbi:hypothetical protein AWENTII_011030 [Aspergillus wentii]